MKDSLTRLLEEQKPAMAKCPVCPVKGICVFVTPGYDPGYCLHEYKLLHAFLARRLRDHPPAGGSQLQTLIAQGREHLQNMRGRWPDLGVGAKSLHLADAAN